jgi:AcrR family transcriptional regulator
MEIETRQARHSAATRTALLRTARRLFAERGYAGTATEEVVRRARVTRGALYYHFRDKRDLFLAVFDREQKQLAARAAAAAAAEPDPWCAMVAASNAFLDACLDRAVQRIVLIDAPAVLGLEQWREADQGYYLAGIKALIRAAVDRGVIEDQPVEPLAHIINGALNEAAMLIARSEDKAAARRSVSGVVERLFEGLRGRPDRGKESGAP